MNVIIELIEIIITAAMPLVVYLFLRKRTGAALKPFLTGFFTYMVISWIRALFRLLLQSGGVGYIAANAALSGVLGEVGRYVAMMYVMHEYDKWHDAIAYGAGHGGAELILGNLPVMVDGFLKGIHAGEVETEGIFSMIAFADCVFIHIVFSVLVMAAVHYRNSKKYLYIAIVVHFLSDLVCGLLMQLDALLSLFVSLCITALLYEYARRTVKTLDNDG